MESTVPTFPSVADKRVGEVINPYLMALRTYFTF
jgi:hypothetical protein